MASRRTKLVSASVLLVAAGGYGLYMATAQEAPPELAQAPLNISNVIPPAFIMALDDSPSMGYQTVFPTQDTQNLIGGGGGACWSGTSDTATNTSWSFFSAPGQLRLDRVGTRGTCGYFYAMTGVRVGNNAIPPIDTFGFARSHVYSPSYFNPGVEYKPWIRGDGTLYADSVGTAARIEPHQTAAINLVSNLLDQEERSLFVAFRGMRLPNGLRYRINGNNNASCTAVTTTGTSANITNGGNGNVQALSSDRVINQDQCSLYIEYWPATFYLPYTANADPRPTLPGSAGVYDNVPRERVVDACGTGCDLWRYRIREQDTVALRNFANWFTYYGNRHRATVAAATHALADTTNMRVGYFRISQHADRDQPLTNAAERVAMYDMASSADRQSLYGSGTSPGNGTLLGLTYAGSGTPNLKAVAAVGEQFKRTDAGAPIKLACQKNAGMLFTDGFSNDGSPSVPAITGLGAPFDPTPANSMAAVATRYYLNTNNTVSDGSLQGAVPGGNSSLRSDLTRGQVPVPDSCKTLAPGSVAWKRLDCQNNLHMNFYGITLGARGNRFNPNANPPQDPFVDAAPNPAWPGHADNQPQTVDDIWHAAINTRGEFINARSPTDITAAMRRILAAVNAGASPSGTIAVTGARVGSGSLTVQPRYEARNNGTDWYSRLTAETVSANPVTGAVTFTERWEAASRLAAQGAGGRMISFGRTTAGNVTPTVRDFSAANVTLADLCTGGRCTAAELQALGSGMNITRAVAYLKGDRTDEGVLRTRTTLLGDIINSSPVLAAPNDDYGYRFLDGTLGSSYATFLDGKKTRSPLVIVGANDGMLHVFNGSATSPPGGNEVFAYIPATALGHMGNLLYPYNPARGDDQKFKHRYLVDGPVTVSDVYFGGSWKTVAVGTAGAGGRSVFALNVTDPGNITVLWEINNLVGGETGERIGNVLAKPVIVPVKSTSGAVTWKVIFGNGYNSTRQQASLFVVDVGTGAVAHIPAVESTPPPYNGLGSVVVVDRKRIDGSNIYDGRDGYSDTVYAADQSGAIWKFNLLNNSLALSQPLFVARDASNNRQTITGGLTTAAGPGNGVMVYFGTGSFSFAGDSLPATLTAQHTLYGILDKGVAVTGRSQLLRQQVGADAGGFRETSSNTNMSGRMGWYLDLPRGERFVGNPRIESGVVFMPTYLPSSGAVADCSASGTNWLYGLNSITGAAALTNVRMGSPTGTKPDSATGAVALTTGGSAPVKDVAVMTTPRVAPLAEGASQEDIDAAVAAQCSMVVRVAGAPPMYLLRPCGRQSWRQVR